jgi:hypothetical protein
MSPTTNNIYKNTIPLIDNPVFCSMVAGANNPADFAGATAYLIDALQYVRAPSNMCSYSTAFNRFLSFCGQPDHAGLLSAALRSALYARKHKAKSQIDKKKWLVFHIGLDWKSAGQIARRDLLIRCLKTSHKVVAPLRTMPYPPAGHWIADTQSAHDRWYDHLTFGKLHDSRNGKDHMPIHILDYQKLTKDIGPHDDAYIVDENGGLCLLYYPCLVL